MTADLAVVSRRIVADHALEPGERILEVRAGPVAAMVITQYGGWRVEQLESADELGVDIFVLGTAVMDADQPRTAFALSPQGRLYRLSSGDDLRSLWQEARPTVRPAAMARLVAEWADAAAGPRAVLDPDGAPLVEETDSAGRTHLALRTRTRSQEPTPGELVERWDVVLGPELLQWRRRPLEAWDREPWELGP